MKRTFEMKMLSLVLSLCLFSAQLTGFAAIINQRVFYDDFESYSEGFNLKNAGYTVWHGASVGSDGSNKYLVVNRTNPIADGENWGSDTRNDARIARQFDEEPGEKVIVSVDFMMPDNPENYSAEIFGVMSDNSNKFSANIRMERGVLYDGRTTSDNSLRTELRQNKWYNAFLVLDLVNDTYKLYSGDCESEEKPFQQPTSGAVDRFVMMRLRSLETPMYFDNVGVSAITHEALEIALCKARGILLEAEAGYENGQYPQTAYTMLNDEYELVKRMTADGSPTEEDMDSAATRLNEALKRFEESKIDTDAQDGVGRYILFNIPSQVAVSDDSDYKCTLSASIFDKSKQMVENEVTWKIADGSGAYIENGQLVINKGTRGNIVIKASAGDIYDYHTITASAGKALKYIDVDSRNGVVHISGEFDEKPENDVNITVKSDVLDLNGTLTVSPDKTFAKDWEVDSQLPFGALKVTIDGADTAQYTEEVPFYGTGWENRVLDAFNSAETEADVEKAVKKYYIGIDLDRESYAYNAEKYNAYILSGVPYSTIDSLAQRIKELACVIAFENITAGNIREVMDANMETLAKNGFREEDFYSLGSDDEVIFYSSALKLSFDSDKDDAAAISNALNGILDKMQASDPGETGEGVIKSVFSDDYESYPIGNSLGGGNYGLRQGVTVIGDDNNQYLEVKRTEPMQSGESFGSDNNQYNARVSKEFDEEPAEQVIVSLDFMMPANPYNYSTELFGVMSDDGNYYAANIRLERGILYDGRLTSSNPMVTDFEAGKWYNAFLYLDLVNNKYKLYCGEYESELKDFQGKVVVKTNRLFMVRVRNYGDPLYIDNLDISGIKYENLGTALYRAKGLMKNSETGYENGQHPQTAYNMLENTYNTILKASYDESLSAEQAAIYADTVNRAIENYKKNVIGTSDSSRNVSYIKFDLPSAIGVDDKNGGALELKAQLYDAFNKQLSISPEWSIAKRCRGVSLNGSVLTAQPGVRGDVVVNAAADGIYDRHTVKLTDFKQVKKLDIDSRNGIIKISGEMNNIPLEKTKITLSGSNINIIREFTTDENAAFSLEENTDKSLPFGYITVNVEGSDTAVYTQKIPFYGVGWKNAVLEEFNSADSAEETGNKIGLFYIGIGADTEKHEKYRSSYNSRVFAKKTFKSFDELSDCIEDLQCVIDFYESTRSDIQLVVQRQLSSLIRNGFDKEKYENLSEEQKIGFYASASALAVNVAQTSAADIAAALNSSVKNIMKDDEVKKPSGSGGSGGGGSGSGGYKIGLVTPNADSNNGNAAPSTEQFADAALAPWAEEALLYLRQKNIMVGDGTNVRPLQPVTRGEVSKLITAAFSFREVSEKHRFVDSENKWWAEYAAVMSGNGIMNGISDDKFGGDEAITRQMLATALDRALLAAGMTLYDKNEGIEFNDMDAVAEYAKGAVERLAKKGIVKGIGNGLFAPEIPVTRAEAAQMIYNVLKQSESK